MNKYSKEQPKQVHTRMPRMYLNFNIHEMSDAELKELYLKENEGMELVSEEPDEYYKEEHKYRYESVDLPIGKWGYSNLVDALITYKYPNDKMTAIINNYLLDPNDEEALQEFTTMQQWRKFSKNLAKSVTNNLEN
jgi:hypothetical protein